MDFSIDDVARTTDDAFVRRRFDQRNLRWWLILLVFFAFASLFAILEDSHRHKPPHVLFSFGSAGLVILGLFLLREAHRAGKPGATRGNWKAGRWIRNHVS